MPVPYIVGLATRIALNTSKVSDYLAANNLPQPSFGLDTPPSPVPRDAVEIEALRQAVLEDTAELRSLMLGPRDLLFSAGSMVKTSQPLDTFHRSSYIKYSKMCSSPNKLSRALAWHEICR